MAAGDPSANEVYKGDFKRSMRSIQAKALVMPCDTDLYFRVSDNEAEVVLLRDAQSYPFDQISGTSQAGASIPRHLRSLTPGSKHFCEVQSGRTLLCQPPQFRQAGVGENYLRGTPTSTEYITQGFVPLLCQACRVPF